MPSEGAAGFCMGGGFAVLHAARAPIGVVGAFWRRMLAFFDEHLSTGREAPEVSPR